MLEGGIRDVLKDKKVLTKKQKEFADEYLETGRFKDGILRSDFNAIKKWFFKEKKTNLITDQQDVYFIRCVETNRIKIGIARNVVSRFDGIQTGSPTKLRIDLIIDWGGRELEQHLHRKFANCRIRGEWFQPDEELELFIADIKEIQQKNSLPKE
jgi:hypothetical protein